ncbi:MAG: hypothetical protein LBH00_06570 [Planctomycetaceae bacterium]|jgi:hypothetical protein|nr:hypothetical protein [Planctomycetaceae bacterium]
MFLTRTALLVSALLSAFFNYAAFGVHAGEIIVPASEPAAHSGKYAPQDSQFGNLGVYNGTNGSVTWKFNIAQAGQYHIQVLYTSREPRPCTFKLEKPKGNPVTVENVCGKATGSFHPHTLKWDSIGGKFDLEPGEYKITLTAAVNFPHMAGFRITGEEQLPQIPALSAEARKNAEEKLLKEQQEIQSKYAEGRKKLRELMPDVKYIVFIKRATFQSSHYYTDFIDGARFFGSELCLLNIDDGTVKSLVPSLKEGIIGRCNLSFDAKKVIFDYKKNADEGFRIWEVGIDGEGLKQLTFPPADEEARIAKYRMDNKGHRHWAGPTTYKHFTDDMHPAYLPDGGFVFASTRCEHGILCDGPDYLTASVIYRASPDGKTLDKLSDNSVSESIPTIMEDGRILYTRWEYVDNGSVTNKGLWALNPDGTASVEIYGANIAYPSVFNTARQIPGEPTKFVCVGAPHMPLGVGTVLLVDAKFDRRTVDGVRYITPEVDQQHQSTWMKPIDGKPFVRLWEPKSVKECTIQGGGSDDHSGSGNTDAGPLFMDPFPITEHDFLVSFNPDKRWNDRNAYGLYYINDQGVRQTFFRDPQYSAWCPVPVKPVRIPGMPTVPKNSELAAKGLAELIVVDIYAGMDNVKRGSIKYIRINEHLPRPWSARRISLEGDKWVPWGGDEYDQQHSVVTKNTHLGVKVQHGIVPVEADGSAHFVVPADKNIFFQALDANYREVQRERTFVNFRPGEIRSCVGCHERASDAPHVAGRTAAIAMQRPYSIPGPQPGEVSGSRPLSYIDDVQPVLDRYCVQCHNNEKKEGNINLAGDLTERFNRSYETLMDWNSFPVIRENRPKGGNNHYMPPYSFGSYASRLVKLLDSGHAEVKLPPEDMIKITTWADSNGQYYGTYFGRKNLKYKGLPDFRPVPTFEETQTAIPPKYR